MKETVIHRENHQLASSKDVFMLSKFSFKLASSFTCVPLSNTFDLLSTLKTCLTGLSNIGSSIYVLPLIGERSFVDDKTRVISHLQHCLNAEFCIHALYFNLFYSVNLSVI